jgi:hypothetical protein
MDIPMVSNIPFDAVYRQTEYLRDRYTVSSPQTIELDAAAMGLNEPDQLPVLFSLVPNLQLVNRDDFEEVKRQNLRMANRLKQLDDAVS